MEGRIWLINHNRSADLHTPFHPPLQVPRIDSQVSRIERRVLPSGSSKIGPQILPPLPLRNFQNFRTPSGIIAISY